VKVRLFITFTLLTGLFLAWPAPAARPALAADQAIAPKPGQSDGQPIEFVANAGQLAPGARFQVQGSSAALFLADDAIWLTVFDKESLAAQPHRPAGATRGGSYVRSGGDSQPPAVRGVNLKIGFVGANARPHIEPFDRLDTHVSYLRGARASWRPDVPVWGGVRYRDLYPGIDLVLSGATGRLEQRLLARPGADLSAVRLRVEGADVQAIDGNELRLVTSASDVRLPLLKVEAEDGRALPAAPPTIAGDTIYAPFARPGAAESAPAPQGAADLGYATFLGGAFDDEVWDVAADSSGAIYVTGETFSPNFPTTPGAFDQKCGSGTAGNCNFDSQFYYLDAFVAKINPAKSGAASLAYATFIGGDSNDVGLGIAVDGNGQVYVTGYTFSSSFSSSFAPVRADGRTAAPQAESVTNPLREAQLSRVPLAGGAAPAAAADPTDDIFVAKLNPTGSSLIYGTTFGFQSGGTQLFDEGYDIAIDASGAAYIAGLSGLDTTNFDALVVKLSPDGNQFVYAVTLSSNDNPSSQNDWANGIAVDTNGNAYIAGRTASPDFPTTSGALDQTCGTNGKCNYDGAYYYDAFVTKLNAAGSDADYSTFLGGDNGDAAYGIAVDSARNAYITGYTYSSTTLIPAATPAYDRTFNGLYDAFVAKLNPAGSKLAYATYLGGSGAEWGNSIALDNTGSAFVTGGTFSGNFPTTPGAYDQTFNGADDAYAIKLNPAGTALAYATFLGGASTDEGSSIAVAPAGGTIYVGGLTSSGNFPTTAGAYDRAYAGNTCGADPNSHTCYDAFVAKLAPVSGPGRISRTYAPIASRFEKPACDLFEPNDQRRSNPRDIPIGTAIQARLCANDIEDNYYFDLARNAKPTITIDLPRALQGKTSIWIYNQENLDSEICGYGGTQQVPRITISTCGSRAPGRYIVRLYTDDSQAVYDNQNVYVLNVTT
jgi:hypothetical protein